MTHDMTRHDSAGMFMLMVVSISSCSASEWWVCSWCIIASPLHDKVCIDFDGVDFHLMLYVHLSPSLVLGMLHVFICSWTSLLECAPCSSRSPSHHVSLMYLSLQSLMMRHHQIRKSPNLTWWIMFISQVQVTGREGKALKLHKAHFRKRWEAPEHCQEKLCRGH